MIPLWFIYEISLVQRKVNHVDPPWGQPARMASSINIYIYILRARMLLGAPGLTTRNKKLLGAPGIATRSKDGTLVERERGRDAF